MTYQHVYRDGGAIALPVGKVVCIGRNYLEHIRELGNVVPETPVLFMKPATALVGLDQPLRLPEGQGSCHHEVELAALIGERLGRADAETARSAVAGYAIALDLTLRELQTELKRKGQPWELAKAFDGACPISPFLRPEELPDPQATDLALSVNGEIRQQGNTRQMMLGIFDPAIPFQQVDDMSVMDTPRRQSCRLRHQGLRPAGRCVRSARCSRASGPRRAPCRPVCS